MKLAWDLINKFEIDRKLSKRDRKEIELVQIQSKMIENNEINQLFLLQFDFFDGF